MPARRSRQGDTGNSVTPKRIGGVHPNEATVGAGDRESLKAPHHGRSVATLFLGTDQDVDKILDRRPGVLVADGAVRVYDLLVKRLDKRVHVCHGSSTVRERVRRANPPCKGTDDEPVPADPRPTVAALL